jgi:hypothetical protein
MVVTIPINSLQYFFILEISYNKGYTISVMIISFEASANVDSDYLGYFSMKYDPELFSDIKENITEISKPEPLSFTLDSSDVKLLYGTFHYLRKMISIPEVENNKFTDKLKIEFGNGRMKDLKKVKLHIDRDYFYFTGYYETSKSQVEFQSLNFDARFIESLEKKHKENVVN